MDRSILLGMTAGAALMFGFGIIWLSMGLLRGRSLAAWLPLSLLFSGSALAASITTLGLRASRIPANAFPMSAQQLATSREIGRHFYMIFGAELAAILLAAVVLPALHYPDYILCGIALIVGVHFFPLAALFRSPAYYGTGLFGCAIGLAGFFVADHKLRQKVVGLSFGLLLWGTAAWIAGTGLLRASQVLHNLPPS